jgi:uncharacterized membrane protein YebE (DUF533 family)
MFDANNLLGRVLNSGAASGFLGGVLGGGAIGLLDSKKGRKVAKSVVKYGGVAAVGALAYHAYNRYKASQAGAAQTAAVPATTAVTAPRGEVEPAQLAPPPANSCFLPDASDRDAVQSMGVTLIRAMIAAAKADGEIDSVEGQRLFGEMDRLDLDAEERAFLLQELSRPVDLDGIVGAASSPELAAEIYAASLMAIDVSNQAESAYLQLLATRLGLQPALVSELQRTVAEGAGVPAGK